MKTFTIPLVVYPFDIIFLFNTTDAQAKKVLRGEWTDKLIMKGAGKFILKKDNNLGIIRCNCQAKLLDAFDIGVLSHEIFHAVVQILEYCGLTLTASSEEAYAHLIGYITREVFKKININNVRTN